MPEATPSFSCEENSDAGLRFMKKRQFILQPLSTGRTTSVISDIRISFKGKILVSDEAKSNQDQGHEHNQVTFVKDLLKEGIQLSRLPQRLSP